MNALLAALVNGFVVSLPLAAAVWLVLRVSRRWMNAATRYAIWWMLLAVVVGLPFHYLPSRPSPHYERITATPGDLPAPVIAQPRAVSSASPHSLRADTPPRFPLRISPGPWSEGIMALWALAAFVMLVRLMVSYALLRKMKRRAAEAPDVVADSARRALQRLGVRRRVRVAVVNDAVSPMVSGPLRPTILLPAEMLKSMEDAEIEQICLHEAAHLARRDDWVLMFQRLLEALLAPHPMVRWIAGQINLEREIACDDLVISVTGSARPYAACLTRIAELAGGLAGSAAAAAVSDERSHLTRRVEMLLDKTRHAGARLLRARLGVIACAVVLATLLAARTPGIVAFAALPRASSPRVIAPKLIAWARPAPTPQAPAPKPAAPQPAREVRVAVSVTDPMGRFVTGLEANAFHVFENGAEEKIVDLAPRAEPVSIIVVWDENGELADLRVRLAQLKTVYMEGFPEVKRVEAMIAELERAARDRESVQSVMDAAPGSHVSFTRVAEDQSILDGVKSAATQLGSVPPEQSAIVLVLDAASSPAGQLAVVNAFGIPVYAVGITRTRGSATSAPGAALPALISESGTASPYPTVAADRIPASLAALAAQLVNQYLIGYVPSGPAEPGKFHAVDVRLTEPVGLPHLTARISSGYAKTR